MLLTFPLLGDDEVRAARSILAQAPWAEGHVTAGSQAAQAKNNEQLPVDCDASRTLQALVLRALDRSPRFLAAALPRKVFPPRFNRYAGAANQFGPHVDNAIRFTAEGTRVRTDLSCTVFLSDPEDYEGGDLVMHGPTQAQRIKLPAGHAVLYQGTQVHEVLPVVRGERLASFFWVESLVRGHEERELLLELDDALVALRSREGDTPESIRLAGIYHRLLRLWADT